MRNEQYGIDRQDQEWLLVLHSLKNAGPDSAGQNEHAPSGRSHQFKLSSSQHAGVNQERLMFSHLSYAPSHCQAVQLGRACDTTDGMLCRNPGRQRKAAGGGGGRRQRPAPDHGHPRRGAQLQQHCDLHLRGQAGVAVQHRGGAGQDAHPRTPSPVRSLPRSGPCQCSGHTAGGLPLNRPSADLRRFSWAGSRVKGLRLRAICQPLL